MHAMPIAMSCGDPAGIGSEIALKAWLSAQKTPSVIAPFYLMADPSHLHDRAQILGLDVPLIECDIAQTEQYFTSALPVVPLNARFNKAFGTPAPDSAAGIIEAIERGVAAIFAGHARALVTCPIAKKPLYDAGFQFPGHTEFLAALAEKQTGQTARPIMLLDGPELRTVPVTIHIPLSEVPRQLTQNAIIETILLTAQDLQMRYHIKHPRIAVAGLNPHAGEGGALGAEDDAIIAPAIAHVQAKGINAFGPLPADTMFHKRARQSYDVAICMYHDQALIPAKALGFDDAVNVTLGLPFVRTSPDHGTAFDIAQQGIARPDSLVAALRLADRLSQKENTA